MTDQPKNEKTEGLKPELPKVEPAKKEPQLVTIVRLWDEPRNGEIAVRIHDEPLADGKPLLYLKANEPIKNRIQVDRNLLYEKTKKKGR